MDENTTTYRSEGRLVEVKGTLEILPSAYPQVKSGLPKKIEGQFRLWEKQVPEIRGKRRVYPCQDRQEVALESVDDALCPIPAVHVQGDKLELGFPLDCDGFLVCGASLIVKNLEVDGKAVRRQLQDDCVVGRNSMPVIPGLECLLQDKAAVGMVGNHQILVARLRLDRKATCDVCVQPADGVYFDEDLMGRYVRRRWRLAGGCWGWRCLGLGLG